MTLQTAFLHSCQGLQKSDEQPRPALQVVDRDPFVGGMGLSDVAGPENNTRNSARGQHAGVREKIDAGRLLLPGAAQELLDQRQARAGFQRR